MDQNHNPPPTRIRLRLFLNPKMRDVQAALGEKEVAAIPTTLENDACELQPVDGRDLFHFAVFKDAGRKRKNREPDVDLNPREQRRLRVEGGGAVNQKWSTIAEKRRLWNTTAHQWWSPHWEGLTTKVQPFDVFCNDDEVQYTWQTFPQHSEDAIRARYRTGQWDRLDSAGKNPFIKQAKRINHGKGYRYKINSWKPYFFPVRNKKNDKGKIFAANYQSDVKFMAQTFGDLGPENSRWKWFYAGVLGAGSFGCALRYDCIDKNNVIQRRVVVKREFLWQYTNDVERWLGAKLKDKSNYILNYLLPSKRAAQGDAGVTYTEFAPCGDLYRLYRHYSLKKWLFPEPFCWYLLHCLAEACCVLEKGKVPKSGASSPGSSETSDEEEWMPIFHFDLKPQNIVLDLPAKNPEYWWQRNYPVPIIADLGGAARYPKVEGKKPAYFNCPARTKRKYDYTFKEPTGSKDGEDHTYHGIAGAGTPGYSPFELLSFNSQFKAMKARREQNAKGEGLVGYLDESQPVRIHSTIFQVGSSVYEGMMNSAEIEPLDQLWWDSQPETVKDPQQDYHPRHQERFSSARMGRPGKNADHTIEGPYSPEQALLPHYSHELVDLVFRCMHPRYQERPTPEELWRETSKMMEKLDQIWPERPAAATGGSQNDDDMDDKNMNSWSTDESSAGSDNETQQQVETRQGQVQNDLASRVARYKDIREQFVDVDTRKVPQIWRVKHNQSIQNDPTAWGKRRARIQRWDRERPARVRKRLTEQRDQAFVERMRLFQVMREYQEAWDTHRGDFIYRLRNPRTREKTKNKTKKELTQEEENDLVADERERFDRLRRKARKRVFSEEFMSGFNKNVAPEKPGTPDPPENQSHPDREDEDELLDYEDYEEDSETAGMGQLIRQGPRMVSLPWDYHPVGATVLNPDRFRTKLGEFEIDSDGDLSTDDSVGEDDTTPT